MFGLSFTHLILLAIIMLVFIGPEQLPEVARTFARLLNEWKRASSEIQGSLTNTFKEDLNLKKMIDPKPADTKPSEKFADLTADSIKAAAVFKDPPVPTTHVTHTEPNDSGDGKS